MTVWQWIVSIIKMGKRAFISCLPMERLQGILCVFAIVYV